MNDMEYCACVCVYVSKGGSRMHMNGSDGILEFEYRDVAHNGPSKIRSQNYYINARSIAMTVTFSYISILFRQCVILCICCLFLFVFVCAYSI